MEERRKREGKCEGGREKEILPAEGENAFILCFSPQCLPSQWPEPKLETQSKSLTRCQEHYLLLPRCAVTGSWSQELKPRIQL